MAMRKPMKPTKRALLNASASRKLNSSKMVDEETYYSLADVEAIAAAVLSEVSTDPTVGITLEPGEHGVILNCINEGGDEYTIDVDLDSEDDQVVDDGAVDEFDEEVDVDSARRRPMNSSRRRRTNASRRRPVGARTGLNSSRADIVDELCEYFTPEEAEEYVTSFEEQTGATATRLATPDEAEQYDGDFWAVKDGKESLWCRGNGFWYECKDLNSSLRRSGRRPAGRVNASKKKITGGNRRRLNCSKEYFAVPMSDRQLIRMIDNDTIDDLTIYNALVDSGYGISEGEMYKESGSKFYYLTWDTDGEYLEA